MDSSPSTAHTHTPSQAADRQPEQQHQDQKEAGSKSISSDLLAEHLQEIRALRQRLEETIRTNERLREQLERKLQEVERDPATNIFIGGSEEPGQLTSELHFLLAQNRTLKEQLSQGARDKQKENDRLRETLARRTAKLEMSRKQCETLRQERSHLQDDFYRLQCESKLQKQQLADTQQLLQSDELLRSEISRLRSRLAQQEKMLTGAVKRLRSTSQLKEGMERIIIDQLSLTHGVLKKARGNLESNYLTVFGLKGLQMEGNPPESPVTDQPAGHPPRRASTPQPSSARSSESSEERRSEASSPCSC
ncbi:uncharacterized protein [Salminus brasiliensis]|uniref:uncharacterized protein n=1 Tax=Salminus brasiliensis TaxID=930266 RepID=UPI003B830CA4